MQKFGDITRKPGVCYRSCFNRSFSRQMRDQKVYSNILTILFGVYVFSNNLWHFVGIRSKVGLKIYHDSIVLMSNRLPNAEESL